MTGVLMEKWLKGFIEKMGQKGHSLLFLDNATYHVVSE
jgi:hypothetical protein